MMTKLIIKIILWLLFRVRKYPIISFSYELRKNGFVIVSKEQWDSLTECDFKERYRDLIYAVENKYPNETRFQTALRLIKTGQQGGHDTNAEMPCLPSKPTS
jgi:hypothetical protein